MDWLAFMLWSWLVFVLGFMGGCWWNHDAYDRGVRDTKRGRIDW